MVSGASTTAPSSERLDADFHRLWTAFGASQVGSAIGYGALPLLAILALHASTFQVTALAALSGLASALVGLRLGPFVEYHRKRPVMVATDLLRFAALGSVPLAAALGSLTFTQLCVVAVVATASDITFTAASTAHLKWLVPAPLRLAANSGLEATMWTASAVATPVGGVLVSWLGATVTIGLDAFSYLLSALGVRAIRTPEPDPPAPARQGRASAGTTAGWSYILGHRGLRALFWNAMVFGGCLMVANSLLAVSMLRDLHLAAWQYGVAMGLAGAPDGTCGLVFVTVSEFLLLFSAGVFNPAFSTYRMGVTDDAYLSRVTMAWSMSAKTAQPVLITLGGLLAMATSVRTALAVAAVTLLLSGLLLPWRAPRQEFDHGHRHP